MFRRGGSESGLLVLASVLVLGQLVLLLIVVLGVMDNLPRLDPIRVTTIKDSSVFTDRRVRTVQSPPVKAEADETTDHVP